MKISALILCAAFALPVQAQTSNLFFLPTEPMLMPLETGKPGDCLIQRETSKSMEWVKCPGAKSSPLGPSPGPIRETDITTTWVGLVAVIFNDNWFRTFWSLKGIELGLRSDGVLVWRKMPDKKP